MYYFLTVEKLTLYNRSTPQLLSENIYLSPPIVLSISPAYLCEDGPHGPLKLSLLHAGNGTFIGLSIRSHPSWTWNQIPSVIQTACSVLQITNSPRRQGQMWIKLTALTLRTSINCLLKPTPSFFIISRVRTRIVFKLVQDRAFPLRSVGCWFWKFNSLLTFERFHLLDYK